MRDDMLVDDHERLNYDNLIKNAHTKPQSHRVF